MNPEENKENEGLLDKVEDMFGGGDDNGNGLLEKLTSFAKEKGINIEDALGGDKDNGLIEKLTSFAKEKGINIEDVLGGGDDNDNGLLDKLKGLFGGK